MTYRPPAYDDRPLTVSDVADVLGMHPQAVKRIDPAELPYFRVGARGDRRYERATVVAYKARRYTRR